jgi:hypothetical protein
VVRLWPPSSERQALAVGLVWLCLTIVFEFFMGLVLLGRPLNQVLGEYNLWGGRVWILFLLWLTLAPLLFHRLKKT